MRKLSALAAVLVISLGTGSCATGEKKMSDAEKAHLYIELAMASLGERDTVSALTYLNNAEKLDSSMAEIPHARSLVFYTKGDLKTAESEVRKSLKINPNYSDACNTYGKFLIDEGKYDQAIPYLTKAAADPLYRDADKAYTNLGIIAYKRNQIAKAAKYLDRAIDASPIGACVAYYYRGHIRIRQSRFTDAIRDYDRATQQFCAGFADAHFALGIAFEYAKRYSDARKKYLEVQQRFPNTALSEQAMERLRNLP